MKIPANTVITVTHVETGKIRHLLTNEPWDTTSPDAVRCVETFPGRTTFHWTYVVPDFYEVTEVFAGEAV